MLNWVEVGLILLVLATPVVWVPALVVAATQPAEAWRATGRSKPWYLAALVLLGVVMAVYYWAVIFRQVRDAALDGRQR